MEHRPPPFCICRSDHSAADEVEFKTEMRQIVFWKGALRGQPGLVTKCQFRQYLLCLLVFGDVTVGVWSNVQFFLVVHRGHLIFFSAKTACRTYGTPNPQWAP